MTKLPISLSKARKARARAEARRRADENAARFGRSKAEKARDQAEIDRIRKHLDRHLARPEAPDGDASPE